MQNRPFFVFNCVEEHAFSDRIDELRQIHSRLDDVWQSVQWRLARNPHAGRSLPEDTSFMVYQSYPVGNTPSFWFLYKIDMSKYELTFHSIIPIDCELGEF